MFKKKQTRTHPKTGLVTSPITSIIIMKLVDLTENAFVKWSIEYNKSLGIDKIRAEHLRYGPPEELAEIVKQILNETAKKEPILRNEYWHTNTTTKKNRGKTRPTFQLKAYNPHFTSKKDSSNIINQKIIYIYTQDPSSISIWKAYH